MLNSYKLLILWAYPNIYMCIRNKSKNRLYTGMTLSIQMCRCNANTMNIIVRYFNYIKILKYKGWSKVIMSHNASRISRALYYRKWESKILITSILFRIENFIKCRWKIENMNVKNVIHMLHSHVINFVWPFYYRSDSWYIEN